MNVGPVRNAIFTMYVIIVTVYVVLIPVLDVINCHAVIASTVMHAGTLEFVPYVFLSVITMVNPNHASQDIASTAMFVQDSA